MPLRSKTLLIISVTLISLIAILYASSRIIVLGGFVQIEEQRTQTNVERVLSALTEDLSVLDRVTQDWSSWDDTYAFIEDGNQDFLNSNMVDSTFTRLRLNLLALIHSSGRMVAGSAFDLKEEKQIPIPQSVQGYFSTSLFLLDNIPKEKGIKGILLLPENPMLISFQPILTSEGKGPSRGILVMGRYLDAVEVMHLADRTRLVLSVYDYHDSAMPPDFKSARSLFSDEVPITIRPISEETIAGYALVRDIYGNEGLIIRVDGPREIYKQGQASLLYFITCLLMAGLVFGAVVLMLLEKVILSRLDRFNRDVMIIGAGGDLSSRVSITGRDELANLANAMNETLEALEHAQKERKKMEEELLNARKLESLGILAGGIAHDFNNILTAILGNISLAKNLARPEDKIFTRLGEAEKASLRAKDLTQQLLTFSRGGTPIKKVTSVAGLLKESVSLVLAGSNVRCELSIPDDLRAVEVDEGQIVQVINNLIINADQAMPDGGTIHVDCKNVTVQGKRIERGLTLQEGEYVLISVKDEGVGIPREYLPKIFDPYFTTKRKGSGLGLATSYSIIKRHSGYLAVESGSGSGTTFYIYLPASNKKIFTVDEKAKKSSFWGRGRVLVMDDEKIVRDLLGHMLKHLGYEVDFARDGVEAIELYGRMKEAGRTFDVVILDLTIPGGMGGKETIGRLKELDPQVRAIVSSGYSNDLVMANYEEYGFKGVVAKPYKVEELSRSLQELLMADDSAKRVNSAHG